MAFKYWKKNRAAAVIGLNLVGGSLALLPGGLSWNILLMNLGAAFFLLLILALLSSCRSTLLAIGCSLALSCVMATTFAYLFVPRQHESIENFVLAVQAIILFGWPLLLVTFLLNSFLFAWYVRSSRVPLTHNGAK